jgi:hypothetical protein
VPRMPRLVFRSRRSGVSGIPRGIGSYRPAKTVQFISSCRRLEAPGMRPRLLRRWLLSPRFTPRRPRRLVAHLQTAIGALRWIGWCGPKHPRASLARCGPAELVLGHLEHGRASSRRMGHILGNRPTIFRATEPARPVTSSEFLVMWRDVVFDAD